jgi:hypothetical protein
MIFCISISQTDAFHLVQISRVNNFLSVKYHRAEVSFPRFSKILQYEFDVEKLKIAQSMNQR